jgi:hypothetical protein
MSFIFDDFQLFLRIYNKLHYFIIIYKQLENELNIVNDYKNGSNLSVLQNNYGGSRKTIRKILFNEGLIDSIEPTRKCYFIGKEHENIGEKLLLRYESEKDLRILNKEFNIPIMSLFNFLRKKNVFDGKYGRQLKIDETRKYPVDEHFFDNIDSEEKAYFLGILYADGTNSLKDTEVSLRLNEDDFEILEKLNNLIQPTKPIGFIPKKSNNHKNQRRLTINSKNISYKLNESGMMPNKTFELEYPTWLIKDLHRHFIRGYFDGDGCVTFNKINKQLDCSFTGTENVMLGIQNVLISKCGFSKTKLSTRHPERNNNVRSLHYFGNGNAKKYYNFIYNDANIFMERKKNKFNKYINLN